LADSPEIGLDAATSRVSGSTGCNTVMGSYTVNGSAFSFGRWQVPGKCAPIWRLRIT
jgi:heat shock protein HslJ